MTVDVALALALTVPDHDQLVRQGMEAGGYTKVVALETKLYDLKQVHQDARHAHNTAIRHIEGLIEDVDSALREARGRLNA